MVTGTGPVRRLGGGPSGRTSDIPAAFPACWGVTGMPPRPRGASHGPPPLLDASRARLGRRRRLARRLRRLSRPALRLRPRWRPWLPTIRLLGAGLGERARLRTRLWSGIWGWLGPPWRVALDPRRCRVTTTLRANAAWPVSART